MSSGFEKFRVRQKTGICNPALEARVRTPLPEDGMTAGDGLAILDHEVEALDAGLLLDFPLLCLGGGHLLLDQEGGRVSLLGTVVDPER
jgi:hypothetical protein